MAGIRLLQQGFLYVLSGLHQGFHYVLRANERAGEIVGRGDVTDEGGAIPGSADVLEKDKKSVGDFPGPIHSTEPEDESKHDPEITFAVAETPIGASDAPKGTDEVPNTNHEQPESCGKLPSAPLKRGLRRVATSVPDSDVPQATKRTKRARNWTPQETEALIKCKLQPSLPKGNAGWELISGQIPERSSQQCRQRWDTVKKSYKKIKDYCVGQSQELSQVSKEEFLSMKLDLTLFTNVHWYQMIDDYSCRPRTPSSGPAANEPNGASTSTHAVGEPNLPGSACPNLEVARPEYLAAAEQRPAAVESAGWRQYEEAGIFIGSYLVLIRTKKHQRCEEAKPVVLTVRWLHLCFSFMVNSSRRLRISSQG